jgi:hypothetical protein
MKIRHTDKVSVRSPKPRWRDSISRWRAKIKKLKEMKTKLKYKR